jgi:hypothetical protein
MNLYGKLSVDFRNAEDHHDRYHCGNYRFEHEEMIDNSQTTYIPVTLRCGMAAMCRPDVLNLCPEILDHLNSDLNQCLEILPGSVRALVRRTRIWVNRSYWHGPRDRPENVNHTTTHHHKEWLIWCVR